jgi:hypothetical protein
VVLNPQNELLLRINTHVSNRKPIFLSIEHLHVRWCVFELNHKTKLLHTLTPMINLNTSITVHQANPKPFVIRQIFSHSFIMLCYIYPPVCEYNTGKSSNGEQNQESKCKQHRCSQPQGTSIKSRQPAEDFNPGWNCDNHSGTSEVRTSVHIQTYSIHVMSPHLEPEYRNSPHSIHHSYVPKYWFTCEKAQHVADNTECGLYLYVNFGVTKKPKQVLVQHNIPPTRG